MAAGRQHRRWRNRCPHDRRPPSQRRFGAISDGSDDGCSAPFRSSSAPRVARRDDERRRRRIGRRALALDHPDLGADRHGHLGFGHVHAKRRDPDDPAAAGPGECVHLQSRRATHPRRPPHGDHRDPGRPSAQPNVPRHAGAGRTRRLVRRSRPPAIPRESTTSTRGALRRDGAPDHHGADDQHGADNHRAARCSADGPVLHGDGFRRRNRGPGRWRVRSEHVSVDRAALCACPPGQYASRADGSYSTTLTIPSGTASGTHSIVVSGMDQQGAVRQVSTTIIVTAAVVAATPVPASPSYTG